MPERIQLRRTKGWRMPPNTVRVCRPGIFGNPFTTADAIDVGYATRESAPAFVVKCFRDWLDYRRLQTSGWWTGEESDRRRKAMLDALPSLRGKNLACFCAPGAPCHADVLLDLANRAAEGGGT
jgi:hypothetical protein